MRRKSKYNNTKTHIGSLKFDSIKESKRYAELRLLERAKKIYDLEVQPRFTLMKAFERDGVKYKKIEYVADFRYKRKGINKVTGKEMVAIFVEDVKSIATMKDAVYRIKKKLLLSQHSAAEFIFKEV